MRKVLSIILGILIIVGIGLGIYLYVAPKLGKENRQIDDWIVTNNLNQYGDPANTAYSNVRPCKNALDCYDYIKKMHPDKPWTK